MGIFYILLVLLSITRLFGELALRVRQPALVGELIAGIVLGVIVHQNAETFPLLSGLTEDRVFRALTDLGIFFLMLLGGIEMRPRELARASWGSLLVATTAMALPLALGTGVAWFFLPDSDYKLAQALFVGTGLAITAVPVAIRVLMDLNQLDTPSGRLIVSAAVFDDVLSLILLAVLTALIETGGLPGAGGIALIAAKMAVFFGLSIAAGHFLLPLVGSFMSRFVRLDELEFSFLLIVAFGFAVVAELLGVHFILGAFIAGLFFGRRTISPEVYEDVKKKVSGITTGFLAPLFFASIGLHLELSAVSAIPVFLVLLIVIAFFSKVAGAALPAMGMGYSKRDATAIGVAMSARGAVELVIADIALRAGLFTQPDPPPPIVEHMFSAIVIVAVVTTLASSGLLRVVLVRRSPAG